MADTAGLTKSVRGAERETCGVARWVDALPGSSERCRGDRTCLMTNVLACGLRVLEGKLVCVAYALMCQLQCGRTFIVVCVYVPTPLSCEPPWACDVRVARVRQERRRADGLKRLSSLVSRRQLIESIRRNYRFR
jgi:hypothetical protein